MWSQSDHINRHSQYFKYNLCENLEIVLSSYLRFLFHRGVTDPKIWFWVLHRKRETPFPNRWQTEPGSPCPTWGCPYTPGPSSEGWSPRKARTPSARGCPSWHWEGFERLTWGLCCVWVLASNARCNPQRTGHISSVLIRPRELKKETGMIMRTNLSRRASKTKS